MWCNGRWGRRWRQQWGALWVVASLVMPMAMGVVGVVTGDGDVSSVHGRGGVLLVMLRVVAPLATLMTVGAAVVGSLMCVAGWRRVWSGRCGLGGGGGCGWTARWSWCRWAALMMGLGCVVAGARVWWW